MMRGSDMGYPALLACHIIDHMGASYSNIAVFTKENIALLPSCSGYQANIIKRA